MHIRKYINYVPKWENHLNIPVYKNYQLPAHEKIYHIRQNLWLYICVCVKERRNSPQKCLDIARTIFQSAKNGQASCGRDVPSAVMHWFQERERSGVHGRRSLGPATCWVSKTRLCNSPYCFGLRLCMQQTHHHHLFHSWHAVFNYDPSLHNVVSVDLDSYDTGTLGESPKIYESGNDRVVLEKGNSFFFSSKGRDCDNKMKIEVQAWDVPPQPWEGKKKHICLSDGPRFTAICKSMK